MALTRLTLIRLADARHLLPQCRRRDFASAREIRFHAAYPDIVLDLTVDDAVINIVEAGYDAGIRLGERLDNDMVALKLFEDGRWIAVAVEGPLIVSHREYAIQAALQGVGIVLWSEHQLRPLIETGQLVPVLEEYSAPFPGWYLYYPKQRYMPTALRAFIDFMRERHA
jgi:DNA-binding transcriptional LysR family regulator